MAKQFKATLVRGSTYILGPLKFERGVPKVVDVETKNKLTARAVDRLTMQGADGKELAVKQKFKFEPISAKEVSAKADKAKELEAMKGDGGVEFTDDQDDEATDTNGDPDNGPGTDEAEEDTKADDTDEFVDEGEGEGDETDDAPAAKVRNPAKKKATGKKGGTRNR